MKADLYTALARSAAGGGLAHRTDAGFVVLTGSDGDEVIALIDAHQNESDLIDRVVAYVHEHDPSAFTMLFTAGGDLYVIAAGNVLVTVTSPSSKLTLTPQSGQVLVHPLNMGINEADAVIQLHNQATTSERGATNELRAGTVSADLIEIAIGAAELRVIETAPAPEPAPTAASPAVADGPPAAADLVFADDPQPSAAPAELEPTAEAAPIAAPTPAPAAAPAPAAVPVAPAHVAPTPASTVGPTMVLGVACSQGHHNHPDAVYCSHCGTKMGVHHTTVLLNGPRPPLGVLVVDDGTTYSLSEDLVIGREPSSHADVVAGAASPMPLTDDTLSMSRKHARIVLDDWSVLVQDLESSNGTFLSRAGQTETWAQLERGSTSPLEPGDRLRIGGRIIQVELHHVR